MSETANSILDDLGVVPPGLPKAPPRPSGSEQLGTHFGGTDLVPTITERQEENIRRYAYWVGVLPACPTENAYLAGICFPKQTAQRIQDSNRSGRTQLVPQAGSIVRLDARRVKKIREVLRRTVIRFLDDPGQKEEPGTGLNIGDLHVRPRRGHLITIKTPEQLQYLRLKGKPAREYIPKEGDAPLARYAFAILCPDQENPTPGPVYPEPLEVLGLSWPEHLELME